MINCRKASRLLSDKQERQLTLAERAALKIHLSMCSACRHFGDQMSILKTISQQYVKGSEASEGQGDSKQNTDS